MRLFIFGIGYTALELINTYRNQFTTISGTVRSPDKARGLIKMGIHAHVFDFVTDTLLDHIAQADVILSCIPPVGKDDPALQLLQKTTQDINAQWIGYLSTVGVYGDHRGEWVDETSATVTKLPRSQNRLIAETGWEDFAKRINARGFIFRLPGIYGPGRNCLRDIVYRTARNIQKPEHVFNRVHVVDITAGIMATIPDHVPAGIYNITDDEPAPHSDVVTYAAGIMGVEPPRTENYEDAPLSEMARSFYLENKRVSNAKISALSNFNLRYPTYREGLAALLQAGEGNFMD